jgi:magnesium transporter
LSLQPGDGDARRHARTALALGSDPLRGDENYLFLQQDLIDRQIIDIHGRKVVRVNDVDLEWLGHGSVHLLRVSEVEVGLRGAVQRVFKGLLPRHTLESLSRRFASRGIPWQFVDVIEVDPARRVKLKIEHERLGRCTPRSWPRFSPIWLPPSAKPSSRPR